MTVRHLRIFAAVVDCGTMYAAAQKLYLSQPTITQAIKELEEHYGCLLFERYGRRLMITPAGQELLGHARELLSVYERMITQAIKELEEHYGCLLFERYGRRLMITPAGQELLGHARELLSVYERMERSMKQNAGQKLLRIGATVVLAEQLLVPMVQAYGAGL